AARAGAFMRVLQWGMFPALGIIGLRSYLSVLGRANLILLVTVAGALINGLLAYTFIFGHFGAPALGMQGAAYASLGTNTAMAAITVAYAVLNPHLKPYELFVRFWRPDWPAFFEVFRLGLPISLTVIAETGMFGASTIMMGWLGAEVLAAHGIALQLASIAFMVPLGLSNAGTVRVGLAYGRKDWPGLGRAGYVALGLTVMTSGVGAMLFWLVPGTLIGLYLDRANPHSAPVLAQGIAMLMIGAVFQLADGLQVTGSALLRGLKDTRIPMLIAAFSYWVVGVPVAYALAFPLGLGGPGIWWGLAVGLALAAILMCWRFHRRAAFGLTPA
ncbi:MAG: MATE family efflux transporter, partial [Acetobacteraceae bacterium]